MSERSLFPVQRGETHTVQLRSPIGSTFTATIVATIHKLPGGRNAYSYDSTVAATYSAASVAEDADYGKGWSLSLADTVTDDLAPGIYLAVPVITYTAPSASVNRPDGWLLEVTA